MHSCLAVLWVISKIDTSRSWVSWLNLMWLISRTTLFWLSYWWVLTVIRWIIDIWWNYRKFSVLNVSPHFLIDNLLVRLARGVSFDFDFQNMVIPIVLTNIYFYSNDYSFGLKVGPRIQSLVAIEIPMKCATWTAQSPGIRQMAWHSTNVQHIAAWRSVYQVFQISIIRESLEVL